MERERAKIYIEKVGETRRRREAELAVGDMEDEILMLREKCEELQDRTAELERNSKMQDKKLKEAEEEIKEMDNLIKSVGSRYMDSEEGESVVESDCNCERDEFGLAPYNSKHTTYNKKLYRIANNAKFNREIATQTAHDQTYTIIPDANTQTKRRVLLPTPNTPPLTANSQTNNTNKQQTTRTTTQTNSTNKQNKPICIYYQQGRCDYNERCFNRHV